MPSGRVTRIEDVQSDAFNSASTHLSIVYSHDAPGDAPRRLFLKRNIRAPWAVEAGARETAFYALANTFALPMVVPCYAAGHDPRNGESTLLLLDVSDTHVVALSRDRIITGDSVPAPEHAEAVARTLARFHAFWWQHPALGEWPCPMIDWYSSEEQFSAYCQGRADEWEHFIAAVGSWLPQKVRTQYEQSMELLPVAWERYIAGRMPSRTNITLTHGDCYFCQFLCPSEHGSAPTYMVDFQSPRGNFAAFDLANLFATFWTPGQRREGDREGNLLRLYHDTLLEAGVQGYSWHDLWTDYRLMVIFYMHVAVWDQISGARTSYWWPKMQCLVGAYEDLRCADLLS